MRVISIGTVSLYVSSSLYHPVFAKNLTQSSSSLNSKSTIVAQMTSTIHVDEFNQWDRRYSDFSFDTSSSAKAERALTQGLITGVATCAGSLGGVKGAIAGATVGAFLSSYATDSITEYYNQFGSVGYGSVVVARYGSRYIIGIELYSDAARTKLVDSNSYETSDF